MLSKPDAFGITGVYITSIKLETMCWHKLWDGIPQGSVLGPIWFLYINKFPIHTQGSEPVLLADDTKYLIKAANQDIINQEINRVMKQSLI